MKKILYIDMDGVLVDFESSFEHVSDSLLEEFDGREDDIPGIFGHMSPKPGAVAAYRDLAELYDTYILSTSPWQNPSAWSDKLRWVKHHLGDVAYKRLILTHHKDLNRGDFLVDDNTKNGADRFAGELLLFGSPRFPGWPAVVRYLREQAESEAGVSASGEEARASERPRQAGVSASGKQAGVSGRGEEAP